MKKLFFVIISISIFAMSGIIAQAAPIAQAGVFVSVQKQVTPDGKVIYEVKCQPTTNCICYETDCNNGMITVNLYMEDGIHTDNYPSSIIAVAPAGIDPEGNEVYLIEVTPLPVIIIE